MITKELLEGCRRYVEWADVQKGDRVLILCDRKLDTELVQAVTIAGEEQGAEMYELRVKGGFSYYSGVTPPPPYLVNKAAEGADIVLGMNPSFGIGSGGITGMKEFFGRYGTSYIKCRMDNIEKMSTDHCRYPLDLLYAMADTVFRKVLKGKKLRVTTKVGTDVTMGINSDYWGGTHLHPRKPGCFTGAGFPGIAFGIVPWEPYNGVIAVQALYPNLKPPEIFLEKPLFLTIKDGKVVKYEGPHAEWVEKDMSRDPYGKMGAECMWGLHPHACPDPKETKKDWFLDLHDRSTALHFAFGNSIGGSGPHYSVVHHDVFTFNPNVYVDGEPVVENGHITTLDDPKIRKIAEKYENPDFYLTEKPLPPEIQKLIGG